MFKVKVGDRVQCVNSGSIVNEPKPNIINGKIYIVLRCIYDDTRFENGSVRLNYLRVKGEYFEEDFFSWRFKTVQEIRKEKLKKLRNDRT